MIAGVGGHNNYLAIADRRQALRTALRLAQSGDVVLVAGKGHEDYQVIGTQKVHFSDQEEVAKYFEELRMEN